jgi:hypothetical protein
MQLDLERRGLSRCAPPGRIQSANMGTKRKARKPAKPRVSDTACETAEIVALLRELREKMGLVEEIEPGNRMLREYQHMRGWAIIELRRIRAGLELDLRRRDISARERKVTVERLNIITLLQSEFEATDDRHPGH